jgi:hypothetical protein
MVVRSLIAIREAELMATLLCADRWRAAAGDVSTGRMVQGLTINAV